MKRRQSGLAAVEFAIVGGFAMMVLFAAIEVGRALFVWNAVGEATRRGARVAVVTGSEDAARTAVLVYDKYLKGLTADHITVDFYNETGGTPTGSADIAFVTVALSGYTHTLMIPAMDLSLAVPTFTTTLPKESMGFDPD